MFEINQLNDTRNLEGIGFHNHPNSNVIKNKKSSFENQNTLGTNRWQNTFQNPMASYVDVNKSYGIDPKNRSFRINNLNATTEPDFEDSNTKQR